MSGHTPGPWVVEDEHEGLFIRAARPFPDDWYVARVTANNGSQEANAHLIAAAPELLAALSRRRDAREYQRRQRELQTPVYAHQKALKRERYRRDPEYRRRQSRSAIRAKRRMQVAA